MTTLLHVSDTHLGKRQYGSDVRRKDFADAFEQAIDIALGTHPEHDNDPVDAVIHTGDLFDRRTPPLPVVRNCIRTLRKLEDGEIPFYGIVGNHERKMDDQWLDLIEETRTASRLNHVPTTVGDVALYGIDSVTKPAWDATEFDLEEPDDGDAFRLLCMHQLLHPPVPEIMADHATAETIEKADLTIDALALGDYHEAEEAVVDGVDVWYPGSTERCSVGEEAPRSVCLLDIEDGTLRRRAIELDTREFRHVAIEFGEDDGYGHAERVIERHDLDGAVALVGLRGERSSVTASAVYDLATERGAAVCKVDDDRGREALDAEHGPSGTVKRPDELIEERLAEASLGGVTRDVEARVRGDNDLGTSHVADWAEERIREAQSTAFDDGDSSGETERNGEAGVADADAATVDDDTVADTDSGTAADGGEDSRLDSWTGTTEHDESGGNETDDGEGRR
ncbi:DNA repair exonuclease [Halococcus salifodinae]|uniref:Metallophosphoesterase n=1 Tax=Halococcus salifodinae DSM 8989 TaxID=1227456 RepID=M0N1Z6_9EURY|nr:DNA repair exonuclease [Halococcus salifodinae]EMA50730.1 metallophosphoesterase [Halococcus salifodinae DSM 8989]